MVLAKRIVDYDRNQSRSFADEALHLLPDDTSIINNWVYVKYCLLDDADLKAYSNKNLGEKACWSARVGLATSHFRSVGVDHNSTELYRSRFEAFALRERELAETLTPVGSLDELGEGAMVLGEQGIGDELMFIGLTQHDRWRHLLSNCLFVLDGRITELTFLNKLNTQANGNRAQLDKYRAFIPAAELYLKMKSVDLNIVIEPWLDIKRERNAVSKYDVAVSWYSLNKEYGNLRSLKLAAVLEWVIQHDLGSRVALLQPVRQADRDCLEYFSKKLSLEICADRENMRIQELCRLMNMSKTVVTADNTIVHLAGSIGCPTFLLLKTAFYDWRWGVLARNASQYSTVKSTFV